MYFFISQQAGKKMTKGGCKERVSRKIEQKASKDKSAQNTDRKKDGW